MSSQENKGIRKNAAPKEEPGKWWRAGLDMVVCLGIVLVSFLAGFVISKFSTHNGDVFMTVAGVALMCTFASVLAAIMAFIRLASHWDARAVWLTALGVGLAAAVAGALAQAFGEMQMQPMWTFGICFSVLSVIGLITGRMGQAYVEKHPLKKKFMQEW